MGITELYVVFAFGLLSSMHCVSMCGPLVVSYSLPLGGRTWAEQALAHLSYNAGRVITYTALGAAAGVLGGAVGFVGRLGGFENLLMIVTGALMIVAGALMLDLLPAGRLQRINPLRYTSKMLRPLGGKISSGSVSSKFSLGLILGFMPCGLVYIAILKAMATGTVVAGMMTMTAFGLGTAVSLLGVGMFSSAFSVKLSRWGNRLAAVSVLLLGLVMVGRGVMPMMRQQPAAEATPEAVPACHHPM